MPDVTRRKKYTTERHRLYTYGISQKHYEELAARQRGLCPICNKTPPILVVDHDHESGTIRGLLCDRCNRAIGHLLDSPGICRRAAEYLRTSGPRPDVTD